MTKKRQSALPSHVASRARDVRRSDRRMGTRASSLVVLARASRPSRAQHASGLTGSRPRATHMSTAAREDAAREDAALDAALDDAHGGHACRSLVVTVDRDGVRREIRAGRDFNRSRWDPVEQNAFLDDRAWHAVDAFYAALTTGATCLRDIRAVGDACEGLRPAGVEVTSASASTSRKTREGRTTFRARLAYHGPSFAGFAWNASCDGAYDGDTFVPGEVSVTAALQTALRPVLDKRRSAPSAGRTDRGVSAAASCVSFWTKLDVNVEDVEKAVNESPPGRARAWRMSETSVVDDSFHATFAAEARRYVYIIPKRQTLAETRTPIAEVDAEIVNRILAPLVGKAVDMHAFARGTPPGSSSDVTFRVARAFEAELPRVPELDGASATAGSTLDGIRRSRSVASGGTLPTTEDADDRRVVVIELVADRFLRKLVRCLCATAVREAASHAGEEFDDVLLHLAEGRDRRAAAPPAPALGLVFAGVEYHE